MANPKLKKAPLVEAIFDFKWEFIKSIKKDDEDYRDPYYRILLSRLFEALKETYPFFEALETASFPEDLIFHTQQYRFRKEKDNWPFVQLGPGILTLNDAVNYKWEIFLPSLSYLLELFEKNHPEIKNVNIKTLNLRYFDAIDFNYNQKDIFDFLENNLKTTITLDKTLFEPDMVDKNPHNVDLKFSFPSKAPSGLIHLRIVKGKREEIDSLMWEIIVESEINKSFDKDLIINWAEEAHRLQHKWFYKLVEGNLVRSFK